MKLNMLEQFLYIFLGGGLGSIARYLVSNITPKYYKGDFPLGTFIVNIVGCFIIGILTALFYMHIGLNAFLVTGFCGGFTTFSSFSKDTFLLLDKKKIRLAFSYVIASSILGIIGIFIGYRVGGGSW